MLFSFGSFSWHFFKLTESFLSHGQSSDKPIVGILHLLQDFSFLVFPFDFFLSISISLLTLPLGSCILSFSSIRAYRILIAVALNSHAYIIMSEFGYDALSIFTSCGVFCLLLCFIIFCWTLNTMCKVGKNHGTQAFSLGLLSREHWAMVTVCCGSKCHMLKLPVMSLLLSPLLSLGFLTDFFLKEIWRLCNSFRCNPLLLYRSPVDVMVRCCGEGMHSVGLWSLFLWDCASGLWPLQVFSLLLWWEE